MKNERVFHPLITRQGLVFQTAAALFFLAVAALGIWLAAHASIGLTFLLFLTPALASVFPVLFLLYGLYTLWRATYILEREGIRLHWGLRVEEIPMTAVLWVHPADELTVPLFLPRFRWPGSLSGMGRLPGLGEVEFMASDSRRLVLVATPERIYAISPADPEAFLTAFQRFTEMGSLAPIPARSLYPAIVLRRVWASIPARALLVSGALLSLVLLVWVSLAVQGRVLLPLGFRSDTLPGLPGPAVRLLLLPTLNAGFYLVDLLVGLFFFRRENGRLLAYLVWGTGCLTAVMFLLAVYFILRVSPI